MAAAGGGQKRAKNVNYYLNGLYVVLISEKCCQTFLSQGLINSINYLVSPFRSDLIKNDNFDQSLHGKKTQFFSGPSMVFRQVFGTRHTS